MKSIGKRDDDTSSNGDVNELRQKAKTMDSGKKVHFSTNFLPHFLHALFRFHALLDLLII